MNIKEFNELATKLIQIRGYLTKERFKALCEKRLLEWRYPWDQYNKSILNFLSIASKELIDALLEFSEKIDSGVMFFTLSDNDDYRKVIFNDNSSQEVNLRYAEGLEQMLEFIRCGKIRQTLRLTDTISKNSDTYRVYEGDVFRVNDYGKERIILAVFDNSYIGGDAYYLELLFTEKYGYLNGKNNPKPNKDNDPIRFTESAFNARENRYNYHVITATQGFHLMGNVFVDYSFLKPTK